jgi:hypothetical protein
MHNRVERQDNFSEMQGGLTAPFDNCQTAEFSLAGGEKPIYLRPNLHLNQVRHIKFASLLS